jgi:hypothetical protein
MSRRRVEYMLRQIARLPEASRQHLIAELTKGARLPGAGGRKPLAKTARAAVAMAKRLSRRGLSLRRIAAKLAEAGLLNERRQHYSAQSVRSMLRGPQKRERRLKRL